MEQLLSNETLEKCIKKWGIPAQLDMVVEECAELIDAIQKLKRKRVTIEKVMEETIDVQIMLEQIEYIYRDHQPLGLWGHLKLSAIRNLEIDLDD